MNREESDREDLIREAVAMPERVEFIVPGLDDRVTIGFRPTGAMSVFVGQDQVFQFDPEGRLRRAFVNGFLYRSQHTTLARLQRVRTHDVTQLLRTDLNADELAAFRTAMTERLSCIADAIRNDIVDLIRSVPAYLDLRSRIAADISDVLAAEPWLSHDIRARR